MNKVSIIGFGRFGAMLHALLSKGFEVDVFDKNPINNTEINEVSLQDALKNETIFIAVPIRDFEELIINISDKQIIKNLKITRKKLSNQALNFEQNKEIIKKLKKTI